MEYLDGHGFMPLGCTHVLNGDGSMGKTYIMAQMAVAARTATPFLGMPIRQGPVIFFSAEEPLKVIWRRIDAICLAEGLEVSTLTGLHVIDHARSPAWLMEEEKRTGQLKFTDLYKSLCKTVASIRPVALILDNRARIFRGNQNDSALATEVISTLDLLADQNGMTVILLSHVSLSQMNSGRGDSGSVAWSNAGPDRDPS